MEKSLHEIYRLQMGAQKTMVQAAGGQQKWEALPEATKSVKCAKMVKDVVQELGKGAFELLNSHEKHFLQLFIWAGSTRASSKLINSWSHQNCTDCWCNIQSQG